MKKMRICVAVALICCVMSGVVAITAADYNSQNDPIVTLSYINDVVLKYIDTNLSNTKAALTATIDTLASRVTKLENTASGAVSTDPEITKRIEALEKENEELKTQSSYKVLELKKGQKVSASEYASSCELILRAGTAMVISSYTDPATAQGLSDMTTGSELYNGTEVPRFHSLLIPRGPDSAGNSRYMIITSDTAYVMARGDYKIE